MRLEYVWPHLPTPFFYAVVMVQVAAFITIQNTNLATFISLVVIAIAFGASNVDCVRPFHIERLAVVTALVLSYLALAEALPNHFLELIHAHGTFVPHLVRVFYNLLWLAVAATALLGYWRNPTRRAPILWISAALFAVILALLPLDVALPLEAPWVVFLRFNVAFMIYISVAVGDAAFLTERAYRSAAKREDYDEDLADDVDTSLVRTLCWIPLSVWALYVKPILLILPIAVFVLLSYIAFGRWKLLVNARERFIEGHRPHYNESLWRPGKTKRPQSIHHSQLGEVRVDELTRDDLVGLLVASSSNRHEGMPVISSKTSSLPSRKRGRRHKGS